MPVWRGFLIVPVDIQVVAPTFMKSKHHFSKTSNLIVGFRTAVRLNTIMGFAWAHS